MVGLRLLEAARAAGLTVMAEGDRLVVRGPKHAGKLALQLLNSKAEVMAAMARADTAPPGQPTGDTVEFGDDVIAVWEDSPDVPDPCPICGSVLRWWNLLGHDRCLICDPPATASKLLARVQSIRQRDERDGEPTSSAI
jgi:hypothetical protein